MNNPAHLPSSRLDMLASQNALTPSLLSPAVAKANHLTVQTYSAVVARNGFVTGPPSRPSPMPLALPSRRAFSLLELLLVIAIMGIVAAFVVPAASTIVRGTALNQASQMLTDRLSLGRQSAITKNHPIEVRFLQFASAGNAGRERVATIELAVPRHPVDGSLRVRLGGELR